MNAPLHHLNELFLWTLNVSWQASCLALLILGVQFAFRKWLPARWRYALWLLVVARLLIPALPESSLSVDRWLHLPARSEHVALPLAETSPLPAPSVINNAEPGGLAPLAALAFRQQNWLALQILAVLWTAGALGLAGVLLVLHIRFRRSLRQARDLTSGEIGEQLALCASELGLKSKVRLLETNTVSTPAVFGVFRPALLVPEGLGQSLNSEELRMVFLHELAHVRRGDLLVNALLTALQVIHWFNPLLWMTFNRLRFDRECATDSLVLAGERAELKGLYGQTLLKLVESFSLPLRRQQVIGIVEDKKRLSERFLRIRQATPGGYGWSLLGFALLVVIAVTTLTQSKAQNSQSPVPSTGRTLKPGESDAVTLTMAGGKLTQKEADQLEKDLAANPNQAGLQTELLGYYFRQRTSDQGAKDAAQSHILWVINNIPASPIAGLPYIQIQKLNDPTHYKEALDAWTDQISAHPDEAQVLGNAAAFVLLSDPKMAERLLLQAKAMEPNNATWPERLGFLYSLRAKDPRNAGTDDKKKAFVAYEEAIQHKTGEECFAMLQPLAEAAFQAGNLAKAKYYSEEILGLAPSFKKNWNYGNAIYSGNSILGLVALINGNVAEAKTFLIAASETPGSPQLNSFGPDLTLAQALLDKGESDIVLAYLDNISKFWKFKGDKVRDWEDDIRHGKTPKMKQFGL